MTDSRPTVAREFGYRNRPWRNWAGNVTASAARYVRASSEAGVAAVVRAAAADGLTVRTVGAGHSFSALAATDGLLLNLDPLSGLLAFDPANGAVTVAAGTRLYELNRLLADLGRAMTNLGDVDRQSIAGAISTGTHGSGLALGSVGSQVLSVRLVDGLGQLRTIDSGPELAAARLSLGALGVITAVTLATVPAYDLELRTRKARFDEIRRDALELAAQHRHLDFFWVPGTDVAQLKTIDLATRPAQSRGALWAHKVNDHVIENGALNTFTQLSRRIPASTPVVNGGIAACIGPSHRVAASHQVLITPRWMRFTETEYAVPASSVAAVLGVLGRLFAGARYNVSIPIEVRFAAGDDALLSTTQGQPTGYIAVHVTRGVDPAPVFAAVEPIFAAFGGRPHWGKCHSLGYSRLSALYPRLDEFTALRARYDPDEVFATPYLRSLLWG